MTSDVISGSAIQNDIRYHGIGSEIWPHGQFSVLPKHTTFTVALKFFCCTKLLWFVHKCFIRLVEQAHNYRLAGCKQLVLFSFTVAVKNRSLDSQHYKHFLEGQLFTQHLHPDIILDTEFRVQIRKWKICSVNAQMGFLFLIIHWIPAADRRATFPSKRSDKFVIYTCLKWEQIRKLSQFQKTFRSKLSLVIKLEWLHLGMGRMDPNVHMLWCIVYWFRHVDLKGWFSETPRGPNASCFLPH